MDKKGKSYSKRRERARGSKMVLQSNLSLHVVRHRKRTTKQVATLYKKGRHTGLPLSTDTTHTRTIGRVPGRKVQLAH